MKFWSSNILTGSQTRGRSSRQDCAIVDPDKRVYGGMEMKKTKAAFRALREECGLTQKDVADEAGVTILSAKKWENPASDIKEPPDDAWEWLLDTSRALEEEAQKIFEALKSMYRADAPVALGYYRSQEQLDEVQIPAGLDRPVGYMNAVTRRVAALLHEAHMDFDIYYAEQMKFVEGITKIRN